MSFKQPETMIILVVQWWIYIFLFPNIVNGDCYFPAIYNFGDSNSATGMPVSPAKPTGRSSDGHLIIDFICEKLKLTYLKPYANSDGGDFSHGANFAVGGASIRPGDGFSESNLGVQVSLFQQLKAHSSHQTDIFYNALYTLDIGQNDLAYGFKHTSEGQVQASIPDILDHFSAAIQTLYKEGARMFWVHGTGPVGCLPNNVIYYNYKDRNLDQIGCIKSQNDVAQDYNKQLKDKVAWLRTQLPNSVFTYADVYSAKYTLISDSKNQGFVDPMNYCCGSNFGYHMECGQTVTINGTVYGGPCNNPSHHISWDGVHYCEAANQRVAQHILFGSLVDPSVSITQACQK